MLSLLALGVGAGRTHVYDRECSSAFVVCVGSVPVLMLDAGLGVTAAALQHRPRLPQHIYVSHNHTDHAGELPVMLSVEALRRRAGVAPPNVFAERTVMKRLKEHRLHELHSSGRALDDYARFVEAEEGRSTPVGAWGLSLTPVRARHSEPAFGLLVERDGEPVLGWTSDSGYSEELYSKLAAAPVVLVDARAEGSAEHASFDEVGEAARSGPLRDCTVYVIGYGRADEAPTPKTHPEFCAAVRVLRPGDTVVLGPRFAGGGGLRGSGSGSGSGSFTGAEKRARATAANG